MTSKTIYTVNLVNTEGKIKYSTEFYEKEEALEYITRDTFLEIGLKAVLQEYQPQLQSVFENGKFTETTTFFNGWLLPEKERKLLIDFTEADNGRNMFSEFIYDIGHRLDVSNTIEYGCDEDEVEEYPELKLLEVKAILEKAFEAGVDVITFYK